MVLVVIYSQLVLTYIRISTPVLIYRCQNGVSIVQNINFVLISFLVIFMTIEFIFHLVSYFLAIGGVIFSRK